MDTTLDWFQDEEFWREMYPVFFSPQRFAMAAEQVECVISLTGVEHGAVLDLCCGPGRHAAKFAERGFQVTGVDRSEYLLDRARETGAAVEWVSADMREFVRPGAFDLACSMFTSFGYFEDEEDDRLVLANLFENLRPGGALLIDVIGKETLARRWSATPWLVEAGVRVLNRPIIHDGWGRVSIEWIVLRGETARTFMVHHNLYSGREMKDMLRDAGFTGIRLYGNLHGAPYDLEASRLTVVAKKPV